MSAGSERKREGPRQVRRARGAVAEFRVQPRMPRAHGACPQVHASTQNILPCLGLSCLVLSCLCLFCSFDCWLKCNAFNRTRQLFGGEVGHVTSRCRGLGVLGLLPAVPSLIYSMMGLVGAPRRLERPRVSQVRVAAPSKATLRSPSRAKGRPAERCRRRRFDDGLRAHGRWRDSGGGSHATAGAASLRSRRFEALGAPSGR